MHRESRLGINAYDSRVRRFSKACRGIANNVKSGANFCCECAGMFGCNATLPLALK